MRHMRPVLRENLLRVGDDVPDSTSRPRTLRDVFTIPGFLEDSQQFHAQAKLET